MLETGNRLQTLDEVRQYVADTLSRLETLKADQFQLTQHVINRSGKPCGMYFCLHGPRALRLTAIWETDRNTIFFYGSCGKRMHRTQLVQPPQNGDDTPH
jgi:hypothetical protein